MKLTVFRILVGIGLVLAWGVFSSQANLNSGLVILGGILAALVIALLVLRIFEFEPIKRHQAG
jgi:hypothetical protein